MRIVCFLMMVILLGLVACQKENNLQTVSFEIYQPLTIGSYWVYQHYKVDSLGVEHVINKIDTVRITKDSIISGKEYKILEGVLPPFGNVQHKGIIGLWRDSLHYIVNEKGTRLFSSQDFGQVLFEVTHVSGAPGSTYQTTHRFQMEEHPNSITVPVGTYDCLNYKMTSTSTDPTLSSWYLDKHQNQYYAKDVGKILHTYPIFDGQYERRLIQYSIN